MLTMTSALDRTLRLHGARPAILDGGGNYTWAEFGERIARAAGLLAARGVAKGDRFGILCSTSVRHHELLHAGYWLGAVPVPVNYRLAPPEIAYILDDAGCQLLCVEDEFLGLLETAELSAWAGRALCVGARGAGSPLDNYEDLMAGAGAVAMNDAAENDDAILLYTGGTTGRPKGVRLSHRNVVANGHQIAYAMGAAAGDVYLHIAPMFHAADLLATAFTLAGASHAFLPKFSGPGVLSAIDAHGVSVTMMAPTMIIMTLQEADFSEFGLDTFRLLFYGSSPMAVEWTRRAMKAFKGAELQQGYGLTETSPILTTLDMREHREAVESGDGAILASVGRPVLGVDLRILGDGGAEMPTGEAGEIVVRGPNVAAGYLNRPEESGQAFRNGWFHTGDVGRVDGRGYIYLLDRKKDMVITGGENVYTSEVEAALYQHPDVVEAAVVGIPDDKFGEALFAVIVARPGADLDKAEIIAHCRGRIGDFKIPRQMDFVAEMPKSAMGKILKTELRRMYGGGR